MGKRPRGSGTILHRRAGYIRVRAKSNISGQIKSKATAIAEKLLAGS